MASSCCSDPNVMACLVKYPSERHSRAVQSLSQVVSKEIAHIGVVSFSLVLPSSL
jgi:hypothetical protein